MSTQAISTQGRKEPTFHDDEGPATDRDLEKANFDGAKGDTYKALTQKYLAEAPKLDMEAERNLADSYKSQADTAYVSGPQTLKTQAEADLAAVRKGHVQTEIEYIKGPQTEQTLADATLARARRLHTDAETRFIAGPQTEKASADTRLADAKAGQASADTRLADARVGHVTAEATFIAESQTRRTEAEARFADARTALTRTDEQRLGADIFRIQAESEERLANTDFTRGARTRQAHAEARRNEVDAGLGILSGVIIIGVIILAAAYLVARSL